MRRTDLTDIDILQALMESPRNATYVYRNILSGFTGRGQRRHNLKTASVLTRLKRLERQGKVRRVSTSYVTMIAWEAV